ncbi:hypothetical protein D0867_04843 [Hortaea werneckii]|uniref:F-box domain-containing protein n=1 Tax=Hortaea werneckii TaxID=91943 RepID=A0A3M6ZV44_HORWE|nr:hypothetical protein D0867_04843 [Hortaea werneckii]RMY19587.1 hypothetical protein D0866_12769 [Hortaea werneckii]
MAPFAFLGVLTIAQSSKSVAQSSAAPSTIILLDRSRQNLTRAREAKIRNTFPFLRLPAELRNNVYEYCLDTDIAQRILQRYYEALKDTKDTKIVAAPLIWAKCPVIFRLNRQIYAESSFLVKKCGLTFDHGLMDLLTIKDFVPESLIRTVSSIDINDSGHPLFKENILGASWMGYITLIEELGGILKSGHNLKKFSITLSHEELVPHVTTCWNNTNTCGFRDSLKRAAAALRGVHNVPEVKLVGFPESFALELQKRMKAAPTSFFDLPRELRDLVYERALDWSDISSKLKTSLDACTDKHYDVKYPQRSTPTVLLLNRQITSEALTVLHNKPLVIDCPAEHHLLKERQVPNVMRFITRPTLQNVRHLVLHLQAWEWIHGLKYFLPTFEIAPPSTSETTGGMQTPPPPQAAHGSTNTQLTSFPHHLKTMHIVFRDNLKTRFLADPAQQYPDNTLHESLQPLSKIRGLERVVFEGDLPLSYAEPLKAIMMSPVGAKERLPKLMAVKSNGEVVDAGWDDLK